ncbi:MAG: thiamine phosphate synthase [Lachnospiraceae bacterium]|nr:thiamine phosphate synthase [Lachnospiraceae bacterium]
MCTFKNMLAVTNRRLCERPFLEQIDWLASCHPAGIILREKDLAEEEYRVLAEKVLAICERQGTLCILHTWTECARSLECPDIHLPLWKLRETAGKLGGFRRIGASVHSVKEAEEAYALGASYLTAGHVFLTDCKRGVPARGLDFLKEVCRAVPLPVYGIGGITEENAASVLEQGAAGYCVMSGVMRNP